MNPRKIALIGVFPVLLTAFGKAEAKLNVVATTPDLASIARAVGGDLIEVTAIARPAEDPHFVDARPSFIRLLNQADVLIEGGAQLEAGWLPPLVDSARNAHISVGAPGRISASEGISLLEIPTVLDRSMGDVHPMGNPHYLLDPVNAKIAAATIKVGLCAADHLNCTQYEEGLRRFTAAIDTKLPEWQETLRGVRGTKVVTYHKDFDYFAARFGLVVVDTLEPKPGIPPSPTHLSELVPKMRSQGVRLILAEPNRERQNPEFVAANTGARIVLLPIMPGGKEAVDYIDLIDYDVTQISNAMKTT